MHNTAFIALFAAMTAAGYPIGPFGLIDLIGADINLAATESLSLAMGNHPRYHVFTALQAQVASGNLGRKTGRGFVFPAPPAPAPADAKVIALRIEAALVARSALAGSTFAEDIERQPSGASGDWHWRIHLHPQQIPLREEDGRPAPGAPLRAAMATVEVTRGKDGPTVMTWSTWKPYRAAP